MSDQFRAVSPSKENGVKLCARRKNLPAVTRVRQPTMGDTKQNCLIPPGSISQISSKINNRHLVLRI
jgi:hypothetical protein